jgi:hypothetical protein
MSLPLSFRSNAAPETIHVAPASTTAVLGNNYVVYINITDANDLYAWEFQLDYDKDILDLTSASIVSGGLNTPTQTYYSLTNETTGHLWWAVSTVFPTTSGITYGEHAIFEIQFDAIATGTSNLDLYGTVLSDSDGNAITHSVVDGTITVYERDLTVTSINILDLGCSIYKDDTYNDTSTYYYPVEVTINNAGGLAAGTFYVELEVYSYNTSSIEDSQEISVASLAGGASTVVNFTSLFHPTYTGDYRLTATVDSQDDIVEDDETNNALIEDNVPVTVIGDINGDQSVNILDGVVISLAYTATSASGHWNIKADLDHNGEIDLVDAARISIHWGEIA